jgi:hypothetical protein
VVAAFAVALLLALTAAAVADHPDFCGNFDCPGTSLALHATQACIIGAPRIIVHDMVCTLHCIAYHTVQACKGTDAELFAPLADFEIVQASRAASKVGEVRKYQKASWVYVNITEDSTIAPLSYETATALGYRSLLGYFDGDNDQHKLINRTTPLLTLFYTSDYPKGRSLQSLYSVELWSPLVRCTASHSPMYNA